MERHGALEVDSELRLKLLAISPATIDRLLSKVRTVARGGQRRQAGLSSAVRRSVPVRTFGDWNDPPPGFLEVDFVAHSGPSSSGSYIQTLVLTDIATGWTECVPVLLRESTLVIAAIQRAKSLFPFPVRGVDFDNDSAFMNELVVSWCRAQGFEVTRARAYRKNDQAGVEQKNGAIVRRLVGYGRFEGAAALKELTRLYAGARLHGNLFQPSFKLREKTRVGARVVKRYHDPVPPAARVLIHPDVSDRDKDQLRGMMVSADPIDLFAAIRAAQDDLGKRVDRRGLAKAQDMPLAHPQRFTASLKVAWKMGETRATHRRPYRRTKPIPRRPCMLDHYETDIRQWLTAEPALPAVTILQRLMAMEPSKFSEKNTRRIQILVKAWRAEITRRIIIDSEWPTILPIWPSASAEGQIEDTRTLSAGNIAL